MVSASFLFWLILLMLVIGLGTASIRIFREYERGVVFTLGRFWKVKGPGLIFIIPAILLFVCSFWMSASEARSASSRRSPSIRREH